MEKERYELKDIDKAMVFEFTSIGPKGEIPKLVIYTKTNNARLYNLAFGDKDINTGDIDDLVITDNKDSPKVLATVASTIYAFTKRHPRAFVFVKGSTKARTRLYQIGIPNNLAEITTDFAVLGEKEGTWEHFEKNTAYDAFLITLKKNVNG